MKVYTYSEARQKLAKLLNEAREEGAVRIRRRDGQEFVLRPVVETDSPLNVEGLELDWTREGVPDGGSGFGEQKWAAGLTLPFPLHGTYQWRAANQLAEAGANGEVGSWIADELPPVKWDATQSPDRRAKGGAPRPAR